MTPDQPYPALLAGWLTPAYDLFARLFIPEQRLKRLVIASAHLGPGQRVLDLGAGTGTLAILIKQVQPGARVTGLDGDPQILAIALKKAVRYRVDIDFVPGNATALPFPDQTFDRVFSTLVMSLLSREQKTLAVWESYRVLKSSGELHVADFGPPHTAWGRRMAPTLRRFEPVAGNLDGLLPLLFREVGFEAVTETARFVTLFGTLSVLVGRKP